MFWTADHVIADERRVRSARDSDYQTAARATLSAFARTSTRLQKVVSVVAATRRVAARRSADAGSIACPPDRTDRARLHPRSCTYLRPKMGSQPSSWSKALPVKHSTGPIAQPAHAPSMNTPVPCSIARGGGDAQPESTVLACFLQAVVFGASIPLYLVEADKPFIRARP